jgi:hypothetical protein
MTDADNTVSWRQFEDALVMMARLNGAAREFVSKTWTPSPERDRLLDAMRKANEFVAAAMMGKGKGGSPDGR